MPEHERITADQIEVGDRVARSRTHEFVTVCYIEKHPTAVSLYVREPVANYRSGKFARPRRTAKWWREAR